MGTVLGLAVTAIVIVTVFGLIVSPSRLLDIVGNLYVSGLLVAAVSIIAAAWIGIAISIASAMGLIPFLLLCLLVQGASRRS